MAWKTGEHHTAPQGVVVFGTYEPNMVTWFEADEKPAEPSTTTTAAPAPASAAPAGTKANA